MNIIEHIKEWGSDMSPIYRQTNLDFYIERSSVLYSPVEIKHGFRILSRQVVRVIEDSAVTDFQSNSGVMVRVQSIVGEVLMEWMMCPSLLDRIEDLED